jgi:RES domain-containing protein
LTLSRRERELIAAWTDKAQPLSGVYFRSVSYTFMKPETVLEGAGAAAHGGRFASPGTPAVYLSESDAVATNEVTGRKKRLGGATQDRKRSSFARHHRCYREFDHVESSDNR